MKKFVVLLALLAMVPFASAGLMFSAPDQVNEGETFTVSVIADAGTRSMTLGAITVNGAAGVGAFDLNGLFTVSPKVGTAYDGSINDIVAFQATGTCDAGVEVAAGQIIWSMTLTAGQAGSVISIDDWAGANPLGGPGFPVATKWNGATVDMGGFNVNVVPEPMTMALLGLGGLFIRRRRA